MNILIDIFKLLPSKYKKKSALFIFLLLIATLLEIFGISLIIPILSLVENNNSLQGGVLINILSFFGVKNFENTLLIVLVIFIGIYLIKSFYLMFFYYWQNKFSWSIYERLSGDLLKTYMLRSISFYFSKNSAELVNNTYQECKNYSDAVNKGLKLIVEIGVLLGIFCLLLYFDPKSTIIVFCLIGIFSLVFNKLTRNKIYRLGQERIDAAQSQIKQLQQSFGAFKDIKLKSSEQVFIDNYNKHTKSFSRAAYLHSTIAELPKVGFEMIFVVSMSVLILSLNIDSYNRAEIVPIMGLFAGAAFRAMPSAYRIINSIQAINFARPSLERISRDLKAGYDEKDFKNGSLSSFKFNKEIKVDNLSYSYPGFKNYVIKDFSLVINKNEYLGIVGKSGMGKSTMIDLLMGLLKPNKGKILVDDTDIQNKIRGWQNNIGYVSQSTYLIDDTIKNNIAFAIGKQNINYDLLFKVSEEAQILKFINSLEHKFDTVVGERGVKLSSGQIQRIGIARELYRKPDILIFDEATSSLDLETESDFLNCLENFKKNKTIIFVSHRESALKNCNKVIEIKKSS